MTTPIARIARPAWPVVAMAGLALSLLGLLAIPGDFRSHADPASIAAMASIHVSETGLIVTLMVLTFVPALVYLGVAAIVRYRSVPDSMGLICAYMLVLFGCGVVGPVPWVVFGSPDALGGSPVLTALGRLATPLGLYAFGVFFAFFPSGRVVPRWLRWPVLAAGLALVAGVVLAGTGHADAASDVFQNSGLTLLLVNAGAQVYRYRRVSTPVARQQTKWVLLGLLGTVVVVAAGQLAWLAVPARIARTAAAQTLDGAITWQLALTLIAVGIAVAMLRYRLWDVDLVINRALLYAGLTASVVGIYVLVVAYLGRALRTETTQWMSLVATGVVAVLIQPLRGLLQRGVNRLTYGRRDEPYAVVTELGRRMATSLGPQPLGSVVETVADALRLPYVAVAMRHGGGSAVVAHHGEPVPEPLSVPLTYRSDLVGELLVAPRRPGESLTPRDVRLLHDLARQIGPAVHAVTLTDDLQRSRERLVSAREEERRRLRRDLHDGLGPTLAGLALKAGTVADLIPADPETARRTADALCDEIRGTIAEVRRLVYGLRPPSLDELGLVGAVREAARQRDRPEGPRISVSTEGDLTALPAAVEVAAYRIVHESLTNVGRHARATTCLVRLCRGDDLTLEITDDGIGIAPGQPAGIGLVAIRERAAELGGSAAVEPYAPTGTRVTVRIPLPARERNDDDAVARTGG
jgi:signal transduction histidine kinase